MSDIWEEPDVQVAAMPGEDVYDVAKKAEDWEVGECSLCGLPYTRCDCPDDAEYEVHGDA